MNTFTLTMGPAAEGDSLRLAWGVPGEERQALIDLGRAKSFRAMRDALAATRRFELFVMTHIDADHIGGAMPFVRPAAPIFDVGQVWFNGYRHLVAAKSRRQKAQEIFAPGQGEKLSDGIAKFGWAARWNAAFAQGPISVDSPEAREPIMFPGGLSLQLLSPSDEELAILEKPWGAEIRRLGLVPDTPDPEGPDLAGRERFGIPDVEKLAAEPFVGDGAPPNGSSIAFLAAFEGKRVLFTGDAHSRRLEASLRKLGWSEANRLPLDCFKLAHHGSKGNTSPDLLRIVDCTRFAFSTDGTRHDHPDPQTIARILKADPGRPKELIFNYRQPQATLWDVEGLKRTWNYVCIFPAEGQDGVTIRM